MTNQARLLTVFADGQASGSLTPADMRDFINSAYGDLAAGTPGGSNKAIQYNGSGTFAGFGSFDGSNLTLPGNGIQITNSSGSSAGLTVGNDANNRRALDVNITVDNSNVNLGFPDTNAAEITITSNHLNYSYGGLTNSKTTAIGLATFATFHSAGQCFNRSDSMTKYGMGDTFNESRVVNFYGGPINGDEGQAFRSVSTLQQGGSLTLDTISSVVRAAGNTTITQAITGSQNQQTVNVASTTGINANDWYIVGQEAPTGSPNAEAVQIISVGAGTITAIFYNTHAINVTLTPALVLNVGGNQYGQQRVIVNLSGTSYTTGTVASISGGGFVGSGTTWTTGMVGGSTTNVGAISLTADNYTGPPFNGSGAQAALKSWYQIISVTDNTHLGIFSFSTAGDASYRGLGPGAGGYTIRPAAKILRVNSGNQLICETSSHTWTAGDSIECVICPYPDVSGHVLEQMASYTTGTSGRSYLNIENIGARAFTGITTTAAGNTFGHGNGADPAGWAYGVDLHSCTTGLRIAGGYNAPLTTGMTGIQPCAIQFNNEVVGDSYGRLLWSTTYNANAGQWLQTNSSNGGMDFYATSSGNRGLLQFVASNTGINPDANLPSMAWNGYLNIQGIANTKDSYVRFSTGAQYATPHDQSVDIAYKNNPAPLSGAANGAPGIDAYFNDDSNLQGFGAGTYTIFTASLYGFGAGAKGLAATSNTTNKDSIPVFLGSSVWNGSAAADHWIKIRNHPGSGVDSAPKQLRFDYLSTLSSLAQTFPVTPFYIAESGKITFGYDDNGGGFHTTTGITLDPSVTTAVRAVTYPDVAGFAGVLVAGSNTPASSGATGTPGTIERDGSFMYVCIATNTWIRFGITVSF